MPTFPHCCPMMDDAIDGWRKGCRHHEHASECPDALISTFSDNADYGIMIHDGGTSHIRIRFCPWCGGRLDESEGETGARPATD